MPHGPVLWQVSQDSERGRKRWFGFICHVFRFLIRKLKDLKTQLKGLEEKLAEKHTDVLKEICDLKFQINDIYNKKAEYALFKLKTNYYESGEKAGKLLAGQLRQKEASYAISAVKNKKGELMTSDINKVFTNFYSQLYTSAINPEMKKYDAYFCRINLPQISDDEKELLDGPFSVEEVMKAIK